MVLLTAAFVLLLWLAAALVVASLLGHRLHVVETRGRADEATERPGV